MVLTLRECVVKFLNASKLKFQETEAGVFMLLFPMDPYPDSSKTGLAIFVRGMTVTFCWFCKEFTIPQARLMAGMELVTRINYGLPMGGFVLDRSDGEVLFHTATYVNNMAPTGLFANDERPGILKRAFDMSAMTFARYLPAFKAFIDGKSLGACLTLVNERAPTTQLPYARGGGGGSGGAPVGGGMGGPANRWSLLPKAIETALHNLNLRFSDQNGAFTFIYKTNDPELRVVTIVTPDIPSGFVSIVTRDVDNVDKKFTASRADDVIEFVTRANYGMRIGYLRVDMDARQTSYNSSILFGKDDSHYSFADVVETIRKGIELNYTTFLRYLTGIINVAFNGASAGQEIARIEQSPVPPPVMRTRQGATITEIPDEVRPAPSATPSRIAPRAAPAPAAAAAPASVDELSVMLSELNLTSLLQQLRDEGVTLFDLQSAHDDGSLEDLLLNHYKLPILKVKGFIAKIRASMPNGNGTSGSSGSLAVPSGSGPVRAPSPQPQSTSSSSSVAADADALNVPPEVRLNPADISRGAPLGKGAFGEVVRGTYRGAPVAIKGMDGATPSERADFLAEATFMAKMGPHPNVVQFLGIAVRPGGAAVQIVTELCDGGDLGSRLRDPDWRARWTNDARLNVLLDVAKGMWHLAAKGIVHRDLAARNVLLVRREGGLTAKVSDFGLARVDQSTATLARHRPIAWTAPEGLRDSNPVLTTESDVWSYGVLAWEVATLGARPYEGVADIRGAVLKGQVLQPPPGASDMETMVIRACLQLDPGNRPTFSTLVTRFEQFQALQSSFYAPIFS